MLTSLLRPALHAYGLLRPGGTRRSRPIEGNAGHMGLDEKLWWAHKYFVRAIEDGEPGVAEHFAGRDLHFPLPAGFTAERTAVLASGGDLLSAAEITAANTRHLWDAVADYLAPADLAIANLETPVAPSRPAGAPPRNILAAPPLNTGLDMLRVFTERFGFFSTANNHCLDQDLDGLRETLDVLDAEGVGHVGTARSRAERDHIPVLEVNGITIAVLAYTFSTNGRDVPAGHEYAVNYVRLNHPDCDLAPIERDVRAARIRSGADLVIACLHWSLEFESFPTTTVMRMGHRLIAAGVDVILGNHPHVIHPMERCSVTDPATGRTRDGLIVYAHGDLVSHLPQVPNSRLGYLVRVSIATGTEDGRRSTRITGVDHLLIRRRATFDGDRCTDFRLTDFAAELDAALGDPTVDAAELRELLRLQALAARLLPPAARAAPIPL